MITLKEDKINIFGENSKEKFLNKEKVRTKLQELINDYENNDNHGYIECPYCHSDNLIGYGHYQRNIGVSGEFFKVDIKRVKCKNCGRTHALIPCFIVPYFQEVKDFILVGINEVIVENGGIVEVSNELNITRQILYFWIKRFLNHLTRLKATFSYDLKKIMESLFSGVKEWEKYQQKNGLRILEKVPT